MRQVTAETYLKRLNILGKLADLNDVDKIKTLICQYPRTESYKELLTCAYDYYVRFNNLSWTKPSFNREDVPIFLPTENELDELIGHATYKMSVFLQLLKETAVDAGEAWKLRWIDITGKSVSISPTKNHNSRTLPITDNLLSRLLRLPHKNERVFACKALDDFRRRYEEMKVKLSKKLENPRLKQISFKTFRHWKATMEYSRTKDILHVKWFLGHKRIENTLVYTHLIDFTAEEYTCRVARSIEECSQLIEAGFEYVTQFDGVKLFRKRK
jgi:integrase